jgi:hypothetical protein
LKVLFDTNVVLDVLLDCRPHSDAAATLFAMVEQRRIEGLLGATGIVSRDPKGFARSRLPVYEPGALVKMNEALG